MDDLLKTETLYSLSEGDDTTPPEMPQGTLADRSGDMRAIGVLVPEISPSAPTDGSPERETPFIIELRRADDIQGGHFRPEASLIVTPILRTSGLLMTLLAEDLSSLLYMLTFLTPNGDIVPTVVELAQAMDVPERAAVYRMEHLMRCRWEGKPLVLPLMRNSGLHAYMVSPSLITVRIAHPNATPNSAHGEHAASREAVIAHSRATYGKPRRYVEEMIAKLNNWDLPSASHDEHSSEAPLEEARSLHTRLMLAGLSRMQADLLIARYPSARIRDQLEWLPLRFAKSPDRFLIAAVEKDFAPPRGMSIPPERDGKSATDPLAVDSSDEANELAVP